MNKDMLLKRIAEIGYNVGFGAKKHLSTYDIVEKMPGMIAFISLSFGIAGLVIDQLSNKFFGAGFIIFGIISLYISLYDLQKPQYEKAGVDLTELFNELHDLYRKLQADCDFDTIYYQKELKSIEGRYYKIGLSKQIMFSDLYAHYKFFWQHQIDWVDEQKKFRFWRDKIPLSFVLSVVSALLCLSIWKIFQG